MTRHVESEAEASRILEEFPQVILGLLLEHAEAAKSDSMKIYSLPRIILPEGWEYQVYGNCILVRYGDGTPEREVFYVPEIYIEFEYTPTITVKKSVVKRLPANFCSCGREIPLFTKLLWATDKMNQKGIRGFFSRLQGNVASMFLWVSIASNPKHKLTLQYGRHPDCL